MRNCISRLDGYIISAFLLLCKPNAASPLFPCRLLHFFCLKYVWLQPCANDFRVKLGSEFHFAAAGGRNSMRVSSIQVIHSSFSSWGPAGPLDHLTWLSLEDGSVLNVLKPCAGHSNGCSPLARRGVGMGPVELQTGLEKALAVTFLYKNIHNIFFFKSNWHPQ